MTAPAGVAQGVSMQVIRIDRSDDPRLATVSERVRRGITDDGRNCFVAEGRFVVGRLLAERSRSRIDSSERRVIPGTPGVHSRACRRVCRSMCATRTTSPPSPGSTCIAGAWRWRSGRQSAPLADVIGGTDLILVLEAVSDADNVGSAFRNAAAFGAGVVLSEACCDPLYRKAIRTSMGSVLRVPYAHAGNWPNDLRALKAEGFTIVALTPADGAIDLSTCARREPGRRSALLVGSEVPGSRQKPKPWPTCACASRFATTSIR